MTPEKREVLLDSIEGLLPHIDEMAVVFFDRLFVIAPETRPMFVSRPLRDQFVKVVQMIAQLVAMQDDPDRFVRVAAELGRRHGDMGVLDSHYHAVEDALVTVLDQAPAAVVTPAVRAAWHEAYELTAGVMRRAAARPVRQPAAPTAASLGCTDFTKQPSDL